MGFGLVGEGLFGFLGRVWGRWVGDMGFLGVEFGF